MSVRPQGFLEDQFIGLARSKVALRDVLPKEEHRAIRRGFVLVTCGGYKKYSLSGDEAEQKLHAEHLQQAKQKIAQTINDVEVLMYLAILKTDGQIVFRGIRANRK